MRLRVLCAALTLWSATPRCVLAEPAADAERARALFQEGLAAAASGRFDDAARAFAESDGLRAAPATRYNLAAALFELGRYTDAYDALADVSWPANTTGETRNRADGLLRRLELRVSHLRVAVSGDAAHVQVKLDGTALEATALGKPRTLAPGDHALQVSRGPEQVASRVLSLAPRAETAVELVVLPSVAAPVTTPAPAQPASASSEPAPQIWRSWELWTAIGAAVLVGGVAGWAITSATTDDTRTSAPAESSARLAW